MENVIKIPKLLAAMVVRGLIPAVSLPQRPRVNRQRFFVYGTDEQVENSQLPIEWLMEACNQQVYGNIPLDNELPSNAFYGWVEVKDQPYADSSVWCLAGDNPYYRAICPRVFDKPLAIPHEDFEGKLLVHILDGLRVFSVTDAYKPFAFGKELELPVNESLFRSISKVGKVELDLTPEIARLVLDEKGDLLPFTHLSLVCGNRVRRYSFGGDIVTVVNRDWEPILYPSLLERSGKNIRKRLVLHCGDQIR